MRRAPADTKIPEKYQVQGTKRAAEYEQISAIRMRGLPFKATDDEIENFFTGYNIIPNSIKYKLDENGRKSGQACIMFNTRSEALRALAERDKKQMGSRYIELVQIEKSEYDAFD